MSAVDCMRFSGGSRQRESLPPDGPDVALCVGLLGILHPQSSPYLLRPAQIGEKSELRKLGIQEYPSKPPQFVRALMSP
jgi:hypothetical protein